MAQLSDSQLVVLSAACQRPDQSVYPLTAKLPGGAAAKVLGSLLKKALIREVQAKREDAVWREDKKRGRLTLRATPAAFHALGIEQDEAPAHSDGGAEPPAEGSTRSRPKRRAAKSKEKSGRGDSKQAQLIEMLKRTDGATIQEIVAKLKWQAHTVRGAFAGHRTRRPQRCRSALHGHIIDLGRLFLQSGHENTATPIRCTRGLRPFGPLFSDTQCVLTRSRSAWRD